MSIVATAACVGTLGGFLGRYNWLCELASHFRLQYAWILCLSAVLLIIAHRLPEAAVAGGAALINLSCIVPLYARLTRPPAQKTFQVLLANVRSSNRSYERLLRFIRQANPDFVVLVEVTEDWFAALQALERAYPFSKSILLEGGFGILLLSRFPLERGDVMCIGGAGLPSVVAQVSLHGHQLTVVGTHPVSPTRPGRVRFRNQQLAALAEFSRSQAGPLILVGDLNTTSWSPIFQTLLRDAKLRDSRNGFGPQPTWPVLAPLFRVPLDHCLASSEIVVHKRWLGPNIGSDHYPVVVEFSIALSGTGPFGERPSMMVESPERRMRRRWL